jgi:hypothetical protein
MERTNPSHRRRWFRFSLRVLLLLPVAFAAMWWWVTWPGRTLQEFRRLVAEGRTDDAESMVVFDPDYRMSGEEVAHQLNSQPHTQLTHRNWLDVLVARHRFQHNVTLICWVDKGSFWDYQVCESISVERGKIKYKWGCTMYEHHAKEQRARGIPVPPDPISLKNG